MKPELIFHTEGFAARGDLATLASRRADILLRSHPELARIRLTVVYETLPSGTGVYAASGCVNWPEGGTSAIEIAHDADAVIQRVFVRLDRQLAPAESEAPVPVGSRK